MWTVSEATSTAATIASTPSHRAWFETRRNRMPATMLTTIDHADTPVHSGHQRLPTTPPQIRQADGHDQERLEAFSHVMTNACNMLLPFGLSAGASREGRGQGTK